ncbi:hypothetical protein F5Y16DRAFT_182045 [Xylariaceae sp. FL0255]|nr:hypothetical protein F5Y16DRAFT_182045 [Xylariaceae sp. FL0255]
MTLPAPALGALRIASPLDVLRIGIVAAAGFRYSPVFDWERPYHQKFPQDTLLSYRQEFASVIKSHEHIVLVALDKFDPDESKKTKALIPGDNGWTPPAGGDDVVVGVGCWKLEKGSKRLGDFQNDTGDYPDLPHNQDRDKDAAHCDKFGKCTEAAEHKYFSEYSTMEMLAVHPAYWSRGHGGLLTQWGIELARIDQVKQGVIAAKMGEDLYRHLGYKALESLEIPGDEITPQGVTVTAMVLDVDDQTSQKPQEGEKVASEL